MGLKGMVAVAMLIWPGLANGLNRGGGGSDIQRDLREREVEPNEVTVVAWMFLPKPELRSLKS